MNLFHLNGFTQHVAVVTHSKGHTVDVVITKCGDFLLCGGPLVRDTGVGNKHGHLTCDHHAVSLQAAVRKPVPVRQDVTFQRLRNICVENFIHDLSWILTVLRPMNWFPAIHSY